MNELPKMMEPLTPSQRIDERARHIWNEREKTMPRFVRQTWEEGTDLAREATRRLAAGELGFDWRDF